MPPQRRREAKRDGRFDIPRSVAGLRLTLLHAIITNTRAAREDVFSS